MDPEAIRSIQGTRRPPKTPVGLPRLLKVAIAAAVGASLCNLLIYMTGPDLRPVDAESVTPLAIIGTSLVAGLIAATATYAAARTTKRPAVWTAAVGTGLVLASLTIGLTPALVGMHLVTGAWIVGALTWAVAGRGHVRDA